MTTGDASPNEKEPELKIFLGELADDLADCVSSLCVTLIWRMLLNEPVDGTADGVHGIVRVAAISDLLLDGRDGGQPTPEGSIRLHVRSGFC